MDELQVIQRTLFEPIELTQKSDVNEEISLISKALRACTQEEFRSTVDAFLTEEEKDAIETAEKLSLIPQAISVFDDVIRRLSLRFAKLIDWPDAALADIVETRQKIGPKYHYVTLKLHSRNLKGRVVFRISEMGTVVPRMPITALYALRDNMDLWQRVVYLEPVFHKGQVIRSFSELKRLVCRPRDPIIAACLGRGPLNYGYRLSYSLSKRLASRKRSNNSQSVAFLVAHWD